jgi:hypothetical protein
LDLTADELNKILLATDSVGKTVFLVAAKFSEMELNKLLLDTDNEGRTVHHWQNISLNKRYFMQTLIGLKGI